MNVTEKLAKYEESAREGGLWLAKQLGENGLFPEELGSTPCFKAAWGLAAAGPTEAAHRLLDGIRDNLMTAPFEFWPEDVGFVDARRDWRSYYAAIVLIGA